MRPPTTENASNNPPLESAVRVLDAPARDYQGQIIGGGIAVIGSNGDTSVFAQDTPANRILWREYGGVWPCERTQHCWLPMLTDATGDLATFKAKAESARLRVIDPIVSNLQGMLNTPMPVEAGIDPVTLLGADLIRQVRVIADLGPALAQELRSLVRNLHAPLLLNSEYCQLLELISRLSIVELQAGFRRIHVVIVTAGIMSVSANEPPRWGVADDALLNAIKKVYEKWTRGRIGWKANLCIYSVFSAGGWKSGMQPAAAGRERWMFHWPRGVGALAQKSDELSEKYDRMKAFETSWPAALERTLPLRDLIDHCVPITDDERLLIIKQAVDDLLGHGDSYMSIDEIKRRVRFRRSTIASIYYRLQDQEGYQLRWNGDDLLIDDPRRQPPFPRLKPRRRFIDTRRGRWVPGITAALLSGMLTLVKDVIDDDWNWNAMSLQALGIAILLFILSQIVMSLVRRWKWGQPIGELITG